MRKAIRAAICGAAAAFVIAVGGAAGDGHSADLAATPIVPGQVIGVGELEEPLSDQTDPGDLTWQH